MISIQHKWSWCSHPPVLIYYITFTVDDNECLSNSTNACQQVCINTPGSYACQCNDGFELNTNGRDCTGIDKLILGGVLAARDRFILAASGNLEVSMLYQTLLLSSSEIHECDRAIHSCQHICTNTHGSYFCSCRSGFSLASNGFSCNGKFTN